MQVSADKVDSILCLLPECTCEDRSDVNALGVPLVDGPGNSRQDLESAMGFLVETEKADESILVHCQAGRSRSVAVVAQ